MYRAMYLANADHLDEFMPSVMRGLATDADYEAHIRWLERSWQDRDLFVWGVWDGDAYAGEVYLANPAWDVPRMEIGYFIVDDRVGRGYATEAARAVIAHAFDVLGLVRLDLECDADNTASARVADRLGFRREGRRRLAHRKRNGDLVDRLQFGLLRDEWQAG